jgi:hypothetical protein
MRRVTAILSVAAVVLTAAGVIAQSKPSFAGEWKIVADQGQGEPGIDLTITQSATAITVEYRAGGQAPAAVKFICKLDGSESRNMMPARGGGVPTEQVSRAMWTGNTIVVTTATGAGEEKRTFAMQGDNLVVDTSAPARKGGAPSITRMTYQRYQRGHGG